MILSSSKADLMPGALSMAVRASRASLGLSRVGSRWGRIFHISYIECVFNNWLRQWDGADSGNFKSLPRCIIVDRIYHFEAILHSYGQAKFRRNIRSEELEIRSVHWLNMFPRRIDNFSRYQSTRFSWNLSQRWRIWRAFTHAGPSPKFKIRGNDDFCPQGQSRWCCILAQRCCALRRGGAHGNDRFSRCVHLSFKHPWVPNRFSCTKWCISRRCRWPHKMRDTSSDKRSASYTASALLTSPKVQENRGT